MFSRFTESSDYLAVPGMNPEKDNERNAAAVTATRITLHEVKLQMCFVQTKQNNEPNKCTRNISVTLYSAAKIVFEVRNGRVNIKQLEATTCS